LEPLEFAEVLVEELAIILDSPISVETDLLEAGLDSFGTMQVIVFLEEEFGIQVPEEQFDIRDFASVATIADWVLPMIKAAGAIE
jgi:D-alanine--poly(phosphoribitol) ligase subunit 2